MIPCSRLDIVQTSKECQGAVDWTNATRGSRRAFAVRGLKEKPPVAGRPNVLLTADFFLSNPYRPGHADRPAREPLSSRGSRRPWLRWSASTLRSTKRFGA